MRRAGAALKVMSGLVKLNNGFGVGVRVGVGDSGGGGVSGGVGVTDGIGVDGLGGGGLSGEGGGGVVGMGVGEGEGGRGVGDGTGVSGAGVGGGGWFLPSSLLRVWKSSAGLTVSCRGLGTATLPPGAIAGMCERQPNIFGILMMFSILGILQNDVAFKIQTLLLILLCRQCIQAPYKTVSALMEGSATQCEDLLCDVQQQTLIVMLCCTHGVWVACRNGTAYTNILYIYRYIYI